MKKALAMGIVLFILLSGISVNTVEGQVLLEITKKAEPEALIQGEQLTITVKIENEGIREFFNVKVTDTVPDGFELISGSTSIERDSLKRGESVTLEYVLKALEAGDFIFDSATVTYEGRLGTHYSKSSNTVEVHVVAPTPTPTPPPETTPTPTPEVTPTVPPTATPTSPPEATPTPTPVPTVPPTTPIPTPTSTTTPTPTGEPELSISQTSLKEEPEVGEEVLITVAILNKGKATAKNIHLEERVPSSIAVSYVEGANKAGGLVYWNGELDPGEAHSITHTLRILEEKSRTIPVTVTYEDASGKKKQKSTEIYLTAEIEKEAPPSPLSNTPWLYIIILIAVILGGIAIIIAIRRKGEGGAEITIEEDK